MLDMLRVTRSNNSIGMLRFVAIVLAASLVSLSAPARGEQPASAPNLYQRVGGYDFIARFVDTAFPRVASDPQLSRLFQGHSIDSQLRQRQLIVDALCQEMGGPCIYIGRPMRPLHKGLGITESDWTVFIRIIENALIELDVHENERRDWLRMFDEKFRPDIVEAG